MENGVVKRKFHYADFPVTSATSPLQTRDVPFSPNSITPTSPKLPRTGKFLESRRDGSCAKGDVTGCHGRHGEVGIVEFGLKAIADIVMCYHTLVKLLMIIE